MTLLQFSLTLLPLFLVATMGIHMCISRFKRRSSRIVAVLRVLQELEDRKRGTFNG